MITPSRVPARLSHANDLGSAFLRIAYLDTISYPLGLVLSVVTAIFPLFVYFFIGHLVPISPSVGSDYFTFAAVGMIVIHLLAATLDDLGAVVQRAIEVGQFEMYMIEPISWRAIPFALVEWPILRRTLTGSVIVAFAFALEWHIRIGGILPSLFLLILGLAASHIIGILAVAARVIAKRADPVLALYTFAVALLSGAMFPVKLLPGPLRAVSWLIPHTYVIGSIRRELLPHVGSVGGLRFGSAVVALVTFDVVGYLVALTLFERAIESGRRLGALGAY